MKKEEVFAVEEVMDKEATAEYNNKVFFMDCIVTKEDGKFILKKDITDKVNDILKKWNNK